MSQDFYNKSPELRQIRKQLQDSDAAASAAVDGKTRPLYFQITQVEVDGLWRSTAYQRQTGAIAFDENLKNVADDYHNVEALKISLFTGKLAAVPANDYQVQLQEKASPSDSSASLSGDHQQSASFPSSNQFDLRLQLIQQENKYERKFSELKNHYERQQDKSQALITALQADKLKLEELLEEKEEALNGIGDNKPKELIEIGGAFLGKALTKVLKNNPGILESFGVDRETQKKFWDDGRQLESPEQEERPKSALEDIDEFASLDPEHSKGLKLFITGIKAAPFGDFKYLYHIIGELQNPDGSWKAELLKETLEWLKTKTQ